MVERFLDVRASIGTNKVHSGQNRSNMLYYSHSKGIEHSAKVVQIKFLKGVSKMLERMLKVFYEFQVLYIH